MEQFDYIVIGAGSAGCVLANRLSADPKTRVLVIEAGGHDRDLRVKVPRGSWRCMVGRVSITAGSACRSLG